MNEIDWSEAPAWATSFGFAGTSKVPVWYNLKQYQPVSGVQANLVFSFGERVNWSLCDIELIEYRPTKPDEHNDSTEWVDGFPPVGERCEVSVLKQPHKEVEIQAYRNGKVWMFGATIGHIVECLSVCAFRPIKTPEQRMREELSELVAESSLNILGDNGEATRSIADAILSKYNLTEKEK